MEAIITAGGMSAPDDPLYAQTGVAKKALIPLAGRPMINWIVEALIAYFAAYPIAFPDGDVSLFVEPGIMVESALLLLFASVIAGYLPAMRIAREDILTAMRG